MELRFMANDVADTSELNPLFVCGPELAWRDDAGNDHVVETVWKSPVSRSGLFDSSAEWIMASNIVAIPASIAAGLLTNYIWALIQRGRGHSALPVDAAAPGRAPRPPFQNVPSATVVVTVETKRIEIDPLRIEFQSLEILVVSLFDEQNSAQIPSD